MYKASFNTAYLQRELPDKAIIIGDDVYVNEVVKGTLLPNGTYALEKISADTAANALSAATHIMAQSDMTLEYGHVPVENSDYKYVDKIAVTLDESDYLPSSDANEYHGMFASSSLLPDDITEVASGDTALVIGSTGLELYEATVASTTVTWSKEDTFLYEDITKKVAIYKIIDKLDIKVYDAEN